MMPYLFISRGFSATGDVENAFEAVARSGGLHKTRELALKHSRDAVCAIEGIRDSEYKWALVDISQKVLERKK